MDNTLTALLAALVTGAASSALTVYAAGRKVGRIEEALQTLIEEVSGLKEWKDGAAIDAAKVALMVDSHERQLGHIHRALGEHQTRLVQIETAHKQNHG